MILLTGLACVNIESLLSLSRKPYGEFSTSSGFAFLYFMPCMNAAALDALGGISMISAARKFSGMYFFYYTQSRLRCC